MWAVQRYLLFEGFLEPRMAILSAIFALKGEITQFIFFPKGSVFFAWIMVLNSYDASPLEWEDVWECFFIFNIYHIIPPPYCNGHKEKSIVSILEYLKNDERNLQKTNIPWLRDFL